MSSPDFDSAELLDGLRAWVEIETPTDAPQAVNELMGMVGTAYRAAGARIERVPGRNGFGDHLLARTPWRDGEPGVLILSHLDTVHPVGFIRRLPFRVEGDVAYGPGIYDMKAGAYIAYRALSEILRTRPPGCLPVTHLFVSDEEVGSLSSRDLIEAEGRKAKYVLVTEPAREGGQIVTARKGVARFEMRIKGIAAHAGARHEDGRSAVRELARQILWLEDMTDAGRGITVNVGVVRGGSRPNVVPEEAYAEIDLRVPTLALADEIVPRILGATSQTEGVTVAVTGGLNRPPYEANAGVMALFERAKTVAAGLGFELRAMSTGGGSDGNFTAASTPTLDGLGADGKGAHTDHEQIVVSSLAERAKLLHGLMMTLD